MEKNKFEKYKKFRKNLIFFFYVKVKKKKQLNLKYK